MFSTEIIAMGENASSSRSREHPAHTTSSMDPRFRQAPMDPMFHWPHVPVVDSALEVSSKMGTYGTVSHIHLTLVTYHDEAVFHQIRRSVHDYGYRAIDERLDFSRTPYLLTVIISHNIQTPGAGKHKPITSMSLLVLSASDVNRIVSTLTLDDLQYLMAQIFTRLSISSTSAGQDSDSGISMPPRITIPTDNHIALFMPARIGPPQKEGSSPSYICQPGSTAIKVVSVPKRDSSKGLPATTLVLDEATGSVKAVVNARKLTALRNAAGSLLSTSLVGPTVPLSVVAFGAGQQIEANLDLHLRRFFTITKCAIINRTANDRATSLRERMVTRFPHLEINLLSSNFDLNDVNTAEVLPRLEQTVQSADIIICATSSATPLFPSSWVKNGTHVILIGSYTPAMREVDKALVLRAIPSQISSRNPVKSLPILLVDSRDACHHEAGELIDAQITPTQMTEMGEIIPKNEAGEIFRESYLKLAPSRDIQAGFDGPISMFKSVGIGLQDVAIANAVVDKAFSMGGSFGTRVEDYDTQ